MRAPAAAAATVPLATCAGCPSPLRGGARGGGTPCIDVLQSDPSSAARWEGTLRPAPRSISTAASCRRVMLMMGSPANLRKVRTASEELVVGVALLCGDERLRGRAARRHPGRAPQARRRGSRAPAPRPGRDAGRSSPARSSAGRHRAARPARRWCRRGRATGPAPRAGRRAEPAASSRLAHLGGRHAGGVGGKGERPARRHWRAHGQTPPWPRRCGPAPAASRSTRAPRPRASVRHLRIRRHDQHGSEALDLRAASPAHPGA